MTKDPLFKTQIQHVSDWIANLRFEDIPPEVVTLAKLQLLDGIAAICAGARSSAGVQIFKALQHSEAGGPCTVLPGGQKWSLSNAVYFHAAMINALELDTFTFMGHVGQSAVSVSLTMSELLDVNGKDFLTAMIAAQEVSGRLSAYLVSGPQQGHMRAFIHRTAAAVATAKLHRFDSETTARSIAIALSMPEFPLYPASFSPATKVICTSSPSVEGIRSAFLAMEGIDSALDIIEHPAGFVAYFSYMTETPIIWEHIGKSWVALSLSFKNFATCAYAQGPVTAALQIRQSPGFDPAHIEQVKIGGAVLSMVLEKFSAPHTGADFTPVNTHFSTRRSVAAALLFGELTGDFYERDNFERNIPAIKALYEKTELFHDWQLTINMMKGVDKGLTGAGKPGVLSSGSTSATLARFKKAFGSRPFFSAADIPHLFRLAAADRNYFLNRLWLAYRAKLPFFNGTKASYRSHEGDLEKMSFAIGGKVTVKMNNGTRLEGYCEIPAGFAGDTRREEVVEAKYFRETTALLGPEKADNLRNLIAQLPGTSVRDLLTIFQEQKTG